MAKGTKEGPWELKTPPGTSSYTIYKDEHADPPVLVCQVGSTTLRYQARAIEDLHAWLVEQGGWPRSGLLTRTSRPQKAPSRRGGGPPTIPLVAGTGCERGTAAALGCTFRRYWRCSVSPKSPTMLATTRCERFEPARAQGLTEIDRPSGTSSSHVLPGVRVILVPSVSTNTVGWSSSGRSHFP